jgi:hypothetical protein
MAALADSNRTAGSRLQALNEEAHLRNVELSVHQLAHSREAYRPIHRDEIEGPDNPRPASRETARHFFDASKGASIFFL